MPAQVVTPLETMESWEEETQLLARNRLVILLRLCRTAKLDLASARNSHRSVSQSTTAQMSSTACVSALGTSQKIGRNPPHCGLSWRTNLPKLVSVAFGSSRHHPLSKHRESHPQCMQYPPKRNLGEGAAHGGKKNGEEERVVPSESNPEKRERGAEEGNQTLFNHQVDMSISKGRRSSV